MTVASGQEVPDPAEFLGHKLGERWTRHDQIVAWCRLAAERSPRVSLTQYGETWEGRPLLLLAVTHPDNHAGMDRIRATLKQVADPRLLKGADAGKLLEDLPVVVWLSYNVHGNESSPAEAAIMVLHRLATATDAETMKWLKEAVVLVDPTLNPDGRERYVSWFKSVVGRHPNPDRQALEHQEPWPGGRTNHYYFDLNRDWAFATQKETRARLPQFLAWSPQVHVDFHEMGLESSYFFFPAEKPINSNLPEHTLKWGRIFGRGNARAFDSKGWRYYTGEQFDLFYPGYGDSWPSFTGAIGMTYEQAGGGGGGLTTRRRDGSLLTLVDRVRHHATASFATIRTAVENRLALLRDFHEFRRSAVEEGQSGPLRAFLLAPADDPGRLEALVALLALQGIEVQYATRSFTLGQVRDVFGRTIQDRTFEEGTAVVTLAQPLKRLAKTLLEPRTEIKELYFYDVAAWSLPFAYGVAAFQSAVDVPVPLEDAPTSRRPSGVAAGPAGVGYLLRYGSQGAFEALVDLLEAGLKVRSARKSFAFGSQRYDRGTLFLRSAENAADWKTTLERVGTARGVIFIPVDSGYTDFGIDLGSQSVVPVVRPHVALCGGEGTSSTSFGATRYLLDQVMDLPHTVLRIDRLASADLDRYSAVAIPEGRVPPAAARNLTRFAERGGVVVAWGRSAFSLVSGGKNAISRVSAAATPAPKKKPEAKKEPEPRPRWIEDVQAERRKNQQPGSIFLVELDPAHPLSFGYRAEIAAFKGGTRSFDPRGPGTHVGLFREAGELAGYVSKKDLARLKGRAYLSVDSRGRGAFVLFADDPNFRGAWRGMTRLFLNAVLLMPSRQPDSDRTR